MAEVNLQRITAHLNSLCEQEKDARRSLTDLSLSLVTHANLLALLGRIAQERSRLLKAMEEMKGSGSDAVRWTELSKL